MVFEKNTFLKNLRVLFSPALTPSPPSCPWTQKIPIFIFEYFPNANDLDLVLPTLAGYIFYKSMEGRAESEMDRTYGEKSLSNKKSFNKEAMMTEILKGGGESNLAKVHPLIY